MSFLNEHHELEYLEFVDKNTLENKTKADDNTLILIALRIGSVRGVNENKPEANLQNNSVRLIDNCFMT